MWPQARMLTSEIGKRDRFLTSLLRKQLELMLWFVMKTHFRLLMSVQHSNCVLWVKFSKPVTSTVWAQSTKYSSRILKNEGQSKFPTSVASSKNRKHLLLLYYYLKPLTIVVAMNCRLLEIEYEYLCLWKLYVCQKQQLMLNRTTGWFVEKAMRQG